jgi:hypothetical protein
MTVPKLWKIYCMESKYPGMWQRWLRKQCVGVGWAARWGYKLHGETDGGREWITIRNILKEIEVRDKIVVALPYNRVARIGEVVRKEVEDNLWNPLVPESSSLTDGEMGRRILVRWDLECGPSSLDYIVKLPINIRFNGYEVRKALTQIRSIEVSDIEEAMKDKNNWISVNPKFTYERSISDYIAAYPHLLEEGFTQYPHSKIREKKFHDGTRLDVLLIDSNDVPVIVECKQHSPHENDIKQLDHYMTSFEKETGCKARGILVHGGVKAISPDVKKYAEGVETIDIKRFQVRVDFD